MRANNGVPSDGREFQADENPRQGGYGLSDLHWWQAHVHPSQLAGPWHGLSPYARYPYGIAPSRSSRGSFAGRGPKGYRRSDERIREDVCDALTMHPEFDASDIEVEVSSGVVTLTGTVDERVDKREAEFLAESCAGVCDVNNRLHIRTPRALVTK